MQQLQGQVRSRWQPLQGPDRVEDTLIQEVFALKQGQAEEDLQEDLVQGWKTAQPWQPLHLQESHWGSICREGSLTLHNPLEGPGSTLHICIYMQGVSNPSVS